MTDSYEPTYRDDKDECADIDAFQRRLSSFDPAPPQRSWEEVAQYVRTPADAKVELAAKSEFVSPTSSPIKNWRRFATHAAATLVGIIIGVVLMSAQQTPVTAKASGGLRDSGKSESLETAPDAEVVVPRSVAKSKLSNKRNYKTNRFDNGYRSRSTRLTLLTRNIDSLPWQSYQRERSVAGTESTSSEAIETALPDPPKRSTPSQLIREMLNEQTNLQIKHHIQPERTVCSIAFDHF